MLSAWNARGRGLFKKALLWLIQGRQASGLENRLFNTAVLMTALFMLMSGSVNLSLGMPAGLIGFNALALVVYAGLYCFSRFGGRTRLARPLFFYLSLPLLSLAWFFNAGIVGSISFLYLGLSTGALLVLPRQHLLIFWLTLLVDLLSVILLELRFPAWVVPYPTLQAQRLDLGLTLFAALLIIGASLYVFRLQYDQEKRLLELATLYKSRFMASMSHELRTPLNVILGFNRVLQQDKASTLSATQRHYLERMQSNGLHLLELVNEILDLARIEAGQMQTELTSVEIGPLVQDAMPYFQAQAAARDLELRLELPASLPPVRSDASRLRQILNNLIGNAIKYTQRGAVTVRLATTPETCLIEIQDTGPGISPEHQTLIFEPFYQIGPASSSGAGLGLAITYQLCQLLHHRLSLYSEPGNGSCFTVEVARAS